HTLTSASSVAGAGDVRFSGAGVSIAGSYALGGTTTIADGTANFNASASTAAATLSGGALAGTGTLTVTGTMSWTGGDMNDSGTLVIASGASLAIASNNGRIMRGHTIAN